MHAVIFYLTTFGYIDGDFDKQEEAFIRKYIERLVHGRASPQNLAPAVLADVTKRYTQHFHEVFEGINENIKELFTEPVSNGEDPRTFVYSKLKTRCFELFLEFDRPAQESLMETVDELLMADGVAHPAEVKFRGELAALLESDLEIELEPESSEGAPSRVKVNPAQTISGATPDHPFLSQQERHYAKDRTGSGVELNADLALLDRARALFEQQRAAGAGKLAGKKSIRDLPLREPFLDGHVYAHMPGPNERHELLVIGDLHGCYSVLKAALMQSRFLEKVEKWRSDPNALPRPMLVLLGDYIDRGLFSLNGVFRSVLQLFVTVPEHVCVLRGNHEYYIEHQGHMYGGVKPAEAINTLKPYVDLEALRKYRDFFEAMPSVFLFDRFFFVHGGIAKDRLLKEKYRDLSSLNDPDIRFQMMWSDPSSADVIPADLQDASSRFAFGKLQALAFLQKIGSTTIIRGHEKTDAGFVKNYDDANVKLFTVFSAGGKENRDLPPESTYRSVTPMVLTIQWDNFDSTLTPWAPDYASYNDPGKNAFFRTAPEIEHRT